MSTTVNANQDTANQIREIGRHFGASAADVQRLIDGEFSVADAKKILFDKYEGRFRREFQMSQHIGNLTEDEFVRSRRIEEGYEQLSVGSVANEGFTQPPAQRSALEEQFRQEFQAAEHPFSVSEDDYVRSRMIQEGHAALDVGSLAGQ